MAEEPQNFAEMLTPIPRQQGKSITMSFPDAMKQIINGKKVRRMEWETQSDYCLLKEGWLTIFRKGKFHTWLVNDGDMLADDWYIVGELNATN